MVIKIVVPCIDGARKDQVADRPAERCAAARRYDLVAVRHDHGRWCEHTTNELERGHAVAEEQADGSPPVKLPRQGLQRIEGRNQVIVCPHCVGAVSELIEPVGGCRLTTLHVRETAT